MKILFVSCCLLVALVSCAGGLSQEEIAAQEAAVRIEYNRNSAQASAILRDCQNSFAGNDIAKMMTIEKQTLDAGCKLNLAHMEIITQVWDYAITRSVYMEDTDASIELAKHEMDVSRRGMNLIAAATNECLTIGMQQIRSTGGQNAEGFDKLLEYYTVYTQIYDLVVEPKGSLVSYRQTINDLRLETTKLSSGLSIILP